MDDRLHHLAFWARGSLQPNHFYHPACTPCELTLRHGKYFCEQGIQQQFPDDTDLVAMDAESYLGVALYDDQGQPIGGLCVVHDAPIQQPQRVEILMRIFAARAGAEIQRERATQALAQLNRELEQRVQDRTEALQRSEERWQLALQGSNDGIWDWDVTADLVFVSNRWKSMRGYTEAEISDRPEEWLSRIHPDDYDRVMAAVAEHFAGHTEFFELEYRTRCKDGSYLWILDRGQALRDASGQVVRMSGSQTDITQRKLAEAERDRLFTFLQASLNEIYVFDAETLQFQFVNQGAVQNLGYSLEALLQLTPIDLKPEFTEAEFRHLLTPLLTGSQPQLLFETVHQRADGSTYLVEVHLQQHCYQGQSSFLAVILDITDRKQAEEALRQSEQRYATLAATAPVGIFRHDAPFNCVYVNDRWSEMTGRPKESALGMGWMEALHPDDRDELVAQWREGHSQATPGGFIPNYGEGRYLRPDGSVVWYYAQIVQEVDATGRIVGYTGTVTDITERKKIELSLQATNHQLQLANIELARATRLKDEFLANMSHELRTPLNAILGMTEALQEEIYGTITDQQVAAIATIEHSGKHLLELINDILDLAKIESGKLELSLAPCSLPLLCSFSLNLVQPMAAKKNLQLTLTASPDLDTIALDERRIQQVLINLLSNAIKFTPDGGSIAIDVSVRSNKELMKMNIPLPSAPTIRQVICLTVADTGIGIAAADLPKLFQAFVQIDSKLNRQYSGTGLGLALVKRITELHGGWVHVESQLGQGSRFTVILPYQPLSPSPLTTIVPVEQNSAAATVSSEDGGLHYVPIRQPLILLVEDNQANIETYSNYLINYGYRLIVATTGLEAIALATQQPPDLILMDIQLPELDGLEATRQIRALPNLATIPIIALTALVMPGDREKCIKAGINEYLSKPVRLRHLANQIAKLLAH